MVEMPVGDDFLNKGRLQQFIEWWKHKQQL